ncbi:ATP-binding protein [Pasteurella atlantica]|uniref:ATP-binding protein n=2 Tax=Pasteurellaceae TaxID=712 RepID=A0ACC6HKS9_9PAST|nr:ATP-binding protein [Pasteurella atlantica]MDP8051466.1 ATP-binding protein [Pasteurella atlantica]MDP8104654.1 ATP-binding protein [Pasteurella atlantica]MDP8148124.1 ATP-binding protein [Pasteurella atlantica]
MKKSEPKYQRNNEILANEDDFKEEQEMDEVLAQGEKSFLFQKDLKLNFDDVAGLDELKKKANMKIIMPFKKPELFQKYNKKVGGGILMYGAPGCGKTFFAKAIAGECNATFFHVSINEILDMWLGNSEKNIALLFKQAREHKPAIIFIDELDALGGKRESNHASRASVINTFLAELDGFDTDNEGVLVIGATNTPWEVDNAFKRTGRFDTMFFVTPPDESSRSKLFELLLKNIPHKDIDYGKLAQETNFYSGADIKGIVDKTTEVVLEEILETGKERDIVTEDLLGVIATTNSTVLHWFELVENVLDYANETGEYDEVEEFVQFNKPNKPKKKRLMGFL